MLYFFRTLRICLLLLLINQPFLPDVLRSGWLVAVLIVAYLFVNILPRYKKGAGARLNALIGGYELLLDGVIVLTIEFAIIAIFWKKILQEPDRTLINLGGVMFLVYMAVMLFNGFVRVLVTSKSLRVIWRVLFFLLWWVPLFNIYLFYKVLHKVRQEFEFSLHHEALLDVHAENQDCATRYPLLMVHGIFFRDWQLMNYWGRIPGELKRCGAKIYYGNQQSAAPVTEAGAELAETIKKIISETGCEKVNIIAHSKGGLDSRFAISQLGMAPFVASLTTINTPHRGCGWAETLLGKMPKSVVSHIESTYNSMFKRLGDKHPDFLGGVRDLTRSAAEEFNRLAVDNPEIYYQSVMSSMSKASSSPFPLDACWRVVNHYDKERNDGLVTVSSAPWGNFLGEIRTKKRRGVSHGDIVDLFREDYEGFDVREFYADIVRDLKLKGY